MCHRCAQTIQALDSHFIPGKKASALVGVTPGELNLLRALKVEHPDELTILARKRRDVLDVFFFATTTELYAYVWWHLDRLRKERDHVERSFAAPSINPSSVRRSFRSRPIALKPKEMSCRSTAQSTAR